MNMTLLIYAIIIIIHSLTLFHGHSHVFPDIRCVWTRTCLVGHGKSIPDYSTSIPIHGKMIPIYVKMLSKFYYAWQRFHW
jgi:hypothetical protein